MKRFIKRPVLLVTLLVIPVLPFIFLKLFGKNSYKLPVYFATDSIQVNGKYTVTGAESIPSFQLTDQDGKTFSSDQLKDKIFVADFFFTRCGGICPKMTNQLVRVQEQFKSDDDFQLVSVTVDPEYDSSSVLKNYASQFGAISGKWTFLTGRKDSIYHLAQKGFYISALEDEKQPTNFIHSEKLILVDKKGWIRGYYNGTDQEDVDRLITEIKVLKQIYAER